MIVDRLAGSGRAINNAGVMPANDLDALEVRELYDRLLLGIGASPLHLLWWFPLSVVLGVLSLALPVWVRFNMSCLSWLTGWVHHRDPPNAPSSPRREPGAVRKPPCPARLRRSRRR